MLVVASRRFDSDFLHIMSPKRLTADQVRALILNEDENELDASDYGNDSAFEVESDHGNDDENVVHDEFNLSALCIMFSLPHLSVVSSILPGIFMYRYW